MVLFENSQANKKTKNMFKVMTEKTLGLFQFMLFGSLLLSLEHLFTSVAESAFNKDPRL